MGLGWGECGAIGLGWGGERGEGFPSIVIEVLIDFNDCCMLPLPDLCDSH